MEVAINIQVPNQPVQLNFSELLVERIAALYSLHSCNSPSFSIPHIVFQLISMI